MSATLFGPGPRIVGLDLSLTATGIATEDGARSLDTPAKKVSGPARLVRIRDEVLHAVLLPERADLVAIEGYSYGSRSTQAQSTGELGGVIRVALYDAGIPYVEVPPATVKVYATGRGVADKPEVVACARERFGYVGFNEDEADAWIVRALALAAYGHPIATLPQTHRRALEGVTWPDLPKLKVAV